MKKLLLTICLFCSSLLVFAGCGVQGGNDPVSIHFLKDVFYVDLNVETELEYKVLPSSAVENSVWYRYVIEAEEEVYKLFYDGHVTVSDSRFTGMTVYITMGQLSDSCTVKLKEYPSSIGFYEGADGSAVKETDTVQSGLVYSLDLLGSYDGELQTLKEEYGYKYRITSSNPSVIEVEDESRLLVRSTGRRGNSLITVDIVDDAGNPVREGTKSLSASINLSVEQTIADMYATLDGHIIKDGKSFEISSDSKALYSFEMWFFDASGFAVENAEYNIFFSDDIFDVVNNEGKPAIKLKEGALEGASGPTKEVTVTIQTVKVGPDQLPKKMAFKIVVRI